MTQAFVLLSQLVSTLCMLALSLSVYAVEAKALSRGEVRGDCKKTLKEWEARLEAEPFAFGAFAYSRAQSCGWSLNYNDMDEARERAVTRCHNGKHKDCVIILSREPKALDLWKVCDKDIQGSSAVGCTKLIDSGQIEERYLGPAYNARGRHYQAAGKVKEAIEDYTRATRLVPDEPAYVANIGYLLDADEQFEEAIASFKKALSIARINKRKLTDRKSLMAKYESKIASIKVSIDERQADRRQAATRPDEEICQRSLDERREGWETSIGFRHDVAEAKKRGFDLNVCRRVLGLTGDIALAKETDNSQELQSQGSGNLRKLALVVGIDNYAELPKLRKAVNDGRLMLQTLSRIGYEVVFAENPDRRALNRKMSELQAKIGPGDTVMFYFAGHGVALGGENVLLPADMPEPKSDDEDLVREEGFLVDDIIRRIQKRGAKNAFIVLDACRDNPFIKSGLRNIGTTRGLAKADTPNGVFVLFSAGLGQAALDSLGENDPDPNSIFTRRLVPALQIVGLSATDLAKRLQVEVTELASTVNHHQQPAYYDQIIGEAAINPR